MSSTKLSWNPFLKLLLHLFAKEKIFTEQCQCSGYCARHLDNDVTYTTEELKSNMGQKHVHN